MGKRGGGERQLRGEWGMSKMRGLLKMWRGWPTPHVSAARQPGVTFRRHLLGE